MYFVDIKAKIFFFLNMPFLSFCNIFPCLSVVLISLPKPRRLYKDIDVVILKNNSCQFSKEFIHYIFNTLRPFHRNLNALITADLLWNEYECSTSRRSKM